MDKVFDIASGQVSPGCTSTPGGSGGRPFACSGMEPLRGSCGCGWYPTGAASSLPPTWEKSTRSSRPMIWYLSRFRTADAAASVSANSANPNPLGRPVSLS